MRKKVFALAKKLGAVIEVNCEDRGELDVEVTAPAGFCWRCDGIHCLVGSQWTGEKAADVWADLLKRMEWGVQSCSDPWTICNGDCKNGMLELIGIEQPPTQ